MRFMVMVKANPESESGKVPSTEELAEMGKFNEQLVKARVMLAGEGLLESARGFRVRYEGTTRSIIDGPFTGDLVAGFWVWQVKSREEAIEWAKRIPFKEGEVEIRQIAEAEDFGEAMTPELREQENRLRAATAKK
jgi:hypothetical protein